MIKCLSSSFLSYQVTGVLAVACAAFIYWRFQRLLLVLVPFTTLVVIFLFFLLGAGADGWVDAAGLIKVLCELPLGLGSIVAFSSLSPATRSDLKKYFAWYVNVAVVGNIAMMMLLPTGNTARGHSSRAACAALCVWLLLEMRKAGWGSCVNVVTLIPLLSTSVGAKPPLASSVERRREPPEIFTFSASPLLWIISHAVYRSILVTLPVFDSWRYVLLEPLSLSLTYILFTLYRKGFFVATAADPVDGLHLAHFFGIADTITVATLGTLSHFADHVIDPVDRPLGPFLRNERCNQLVAGLVSDILTWADISCVLIHAAIVAVAMERCLKLY